MSFWYKNEFTNIKTMKKNIIKVIKISLFFDILKLNALEIIELINTLAESYFLIKIYLRSISSINLDSFNNLSIIYMD